MWKDVMPSFVPNYQLENSRGTLFRIEGEMRERSIDVTILTLTSSFSSMVMSDTILICCTAILLLWETSINAVREQETDTQTEMNVNS